ncbi:MAG: hypothetical protein WAT74_02065 [Flavobacteriales bacterium]
MDDLFYDEHAELEITLRNRPHWKQPGKVHFVTWRLADSLAQAQLKQLDFDRREWVRRHGSKPIDALEPAARREYCRLFHERVERWLDAGAGSCVLRQPEARK